MPPFRKFCLPPHPPFLSSPTFTPTDLSIALLLWLNGWLRNIWCSIYLYDIMDLHISNFGNLVPEGRWCVFYALRRQIYWGLTHNMVFWWCFDLISHTQTHTHTHTNTQHTKGPADWHTNTNIYLHQLLCTHSSYLHYTEWIIQNCPHLLIPYLSVLIYRHSF